MTDRGILAAISERCATDIRFFDLTEIVYLDRTRKLFTCVGRHGLYFLKRSSLKFITGGELHYEWIDRFIEDAERESDMVVTLKPERPSSEWSGDQLWIRTFQRARLLNYLQVMWCTDHMYRYGKMARFPRYKSSFPKSLLPSDSTLLSYCKVCPFIGYQEISFEGYTFFLAETFRDRVTAAAQRGSGNYEDPRGFEVAIHIHHGLPMANLAEIGRDSIKATAAEYKKSLADRSRHYTMHLDGPYNKRMNLTDDPCVWIGWELLCETPEAFTMVILLHRQYASALMDISQEMAVVFRISKEAMLESSTTFDGVVHECRIAADTLSPESCIHSCYRDLIQYKLDALLFDEEAYSWLASRMKMQPSILPQCKSFVKTLLHLIDKAHCLQDKELIYTIGEKIPVEENPVVVLNAIVRNGEGFDPYDINSPEQKKLQHQWQRRCARYLGHLLDGELLEGRFRLVDLVSCVGRLGAEGDEIVRQILEFLVHVRSSDWTEPFAGTFLAKISARTPTMSIIFNDRIMSTLMETGYIGRLFPAGDEAGYIRFIALLLRSPWASSNLKASICRQILQAATSSSNAAATGVFLSVKQGNFLMGVVPSLLTIVKSASRSPLSPIEVPTGSAFLASLAVVVLVTLSAENMAVKSILLNAGIAVAVVQQIRSGDADMRDYAIKLAINLTKTVTQRQRFVSAGILPALADVITVEYNSPHRKTINLTREIAALIGQLANEPDAREQLLSRYPTLDCMLFLYHNSEPFSLGRSRIMFALRHLCIQSWQTRQRVGLHVLQTVLQELRNLTKLQALASPTEYTNQCLHLLLAVAMYKPHSAEMLKSDIKGVLENLARNMNVSSVIDKIDQLQSRISKNTRYLEQSGLRNA